MSFLMRITREMVTRYAQVFLVILAFTLMVISSYSFVSNTERDHLRNNALNAISNIETIIRADLLEAEILAGSVSETIRGMILQGSSAEEVNQYIYFINDYLRLETSNNMNITGVIGFYGVFDVFDGKYLGGIRGWYPPKDLVPETRPWYSAAIGADGSVVVTQPYVDAYTEEVALTLARRIFDDKGNPLGIVALDILLDRIRQYVAYVNFAENTYGFIISENLDIIAYPDPSLLGRNFQDARSYFSDLINEFFEKGFLAEVTTTDYRGIESIVFVQELYNGWYMGIVTPKDNYYRSTRHLAFILSALGAIFALMLISMLLHLSKEKASSEGRMQLMFNATPLGVTFWDRKFNVIDCNQNVVDMFDLSSKQEYRDKYYQLSPEYQTDGVPTRERIHEYFKMAMENGYLRFEWTHQKLNGEQVPCEVTLIRDKFKDDFIILGYVRDLREMKKMMREVVQRARLLDTVNTSATILLASNESSSFETTLLKSFDLLGHCLDVDRVQIWRNEIINGEMYFILRYEWLSDFGKTRRPMPYGMQYPYSMKKNWEELFLNRENINSPLSQLSQEDQDFLSYYDLKSIVIIPMFLGGNFWGFFRLDDCRCERTFSAEEISILSSAGLMMTTAVNRNIHQIIMREADERTQILMDAAPLCAIFWDNDLNLIDCNQEAVKLFGLSSKQEFISKFVQLSPEYQPDGMPSREKGVTSVNRALENGYSRFEWMHQTIDGEVIPAEIICVRVRHRDKYTVAEYIRDLREQQAMIAEMRKAEIAEESSKAKSDFLARMSHEIRTPMNAILGITEIQLQDDTIQQSTKEALERIYNSGDLLLGIINDILDLSKIEAGRLELIPTQYDIASLLHDTVQLNMMRYESKPIEFKVDVDENTPLMLIGDELRIKQILNNLISNAFKYTDEGVVSLAVSALQENDDDNFTTLIFRVSDTGQGMTSDQVSKLGSEYSRFNMEANRKTEGAGLGMNITRNLVKLMNGDIKIESTPGLGSIFTVRLPQKIAVPEPLGKELAENLMQLNLSGAVKLRAVQIKREFMPYGKVLIVDDVETNLYVAKGLITPYGLDIDIAMSGYEAIEKIREKNVYDIIFMDHMMPRMDGIEATKIIRNLGYKKPIVALTANALTGQAEVFLASGFDDFISKPIDIRQLNIILNKLIRDKKPVEVVEAAREQRALMIGALKHSNVDLQLAEFFIRDAKKTMKILETIFINKCRSSDDISLFIINVHSMKSALANVGETELSADALKLEQAGRNKNVKLILDELPVFLEKLFAVIEKFELKNRQPDEAAEGDDSLLKEKLLEIKIACCELNKKAAKDLLTELRKKAWQPQVEEALIVIAGFLLHSEFEEAVKVIEEHI